nr:hypothetical protein [Mycolicibacterium malmesburyense]CRL68031.1 trans-2-enoyl-CoA reductase [Mycolicibacterium malmesburyense]
MKHLVVTRFGDPEHSVELTDSPEATPGEGEVSVRLEAATINPSDLLLVRGRYLVRERTDRLTELGAEVVIGELHDRRTLLPALADVDLA